MENTTEKLSELEEWIIQQIEYEKQVEEDNASVKDYAGANRNKLTWKAYENVLLRMAQIQAS